MPTDSSASDGAFKNLLDGAAVDRMALVFAVAEPTFPATAFRRDATDGLSTLELKARVAQVAIALQAALPADFTEAVSVVDRLIVEVADQEGMGGLFLWPVTDWVARAGRDSAAEALELLARLTPYSTGEFAVRPFIDDDPEGVLARFEEWVGRDDEHVRRLVSEGTRPRLPWAPRLAVAEADPGYAVHLLDRLVADPSEFVRRSVSNHLNDLCKVDRSLALRLATQWSERAVAAVDAGESLTAKHIDWVVRRGIRTLVKAGDGDAMRLLGHDPDAALDAVLDMRTATVDMGGAAEWSLVLTSTDERPHRVVVDYAVHFVRANGSTGRKVFKWTTLDLVPRQRVEMQRRHAVVPITTRNYHSGSHLVEVQVNGVVVAADVFELHV